MKIGRPSKFTPELATLICDQLMAGISLREICAAVSMPNRGTVNRWLASNPDFATKYAHAREVQQNIMIDHVINVVEKIESGLIGPNYGRMVINALQWQAEKLKPKVYK